VTIRGLTIALLVASLLVSTITVGRLIWNDGWLDGFDACSEMHR
jgi:hypothetical protein